MSHPGCLVRKHLYENTPNAIPGKRWVLSCQVFLCWLSTYKILSIFYEEKWVSHDHKWTSKREAACDNLELITLLQLQQQMACNEFSLCSLLPLGVGDFSLIWSHNNKTQLALILWRKKRSLCFQDCDGGSNVIYGKARNVRIENGFGGHFQQPK